MERKGSTGSNSKAVLLRKIRNLEIVARQRSESFFQGNRRSRYIGPGTDFSELREYIPGDDLRTIDWLASAKQPNQLIVKEFEQEKNTNIMIVLDTSQSMMLGSPFPRIKMAVEATAALAFTVINNRDNFGFTTFSDNLLTYLPPRGGKLHLYHAFHKMLTTVPIGTTDIGKTLRTIATRLSKRSLILVITDLHDAEASTYDGFKAARTLGHEVQVIHVRDPLEYSLPEKAGRIKVLDDTSDDAIELDLDNPIVRGMYDFEIGKKIRSIHDFKRKLMGLYIRVVDSPTSEVAENVLSTYFRAKRRNLLAR